MKLWIPLCVLALFVVGFLLMKGGDATVAEPSGEESASFSAEPAELPAQDEALEDPEVDEPESRAAVPIDETPHDDVTEEPSTFLVEARFVDPDGAPLGGVEMLVPGIVNGPSAFSNARGEVRLELEWKDVEPFFPQSCGFLFRCSGYAQNGMGHHFRAPEDTYLGTLTLEPGGDVHGYVFDGEGNPALGATVFPVAAVDPEDRQLAARMRIWGGRAVGVPTTTGADGSYTLVGVPAIHLSVAARTDHSFTSVTTAIVPEIGGLVEAPDLVLEANEPPDRIEGFVLDPDGRPVVEERVLLLTLDGNASLAGLTSRSPDGGFSITAERGERYLLQAGRPGHEWPVVQKEVEAGMTNVILAFAASPFFDVRVTATDGRPIRQLAGSVITAEGRGIVNGNSTSENGKTLRLIVPAEDFLVRVWAPGYEFLQKGPFTPEDPPQGLEVVLVPTTGISGRVLAEGRPVSGATVHGHGTFRGEAMRSMWKSRDGFLSTVLPHIMLGGRTDDEGRFFLNSNHACTVFLHASAEGYATTDLGEIVFDPDAGSAEIEIELRRGGTLAGRALVPEGEDPRAFVVGVSRGDGHVLTQVLGEDASFRFEHLTAGPWQVRRCLDENVYLGDRGFFRSEDTPIEWDVEVVEGETAFHELDLRGEEATDLHGRFLLGGKPAVGWTCSWTSGRNHGRPRFDAEGRFRIRIEPPGWTELTILGSRRGGAHTLFRATLEPPGGVQTWEKDVAVGTLELTGLVMKEWEEDPEGNADFSYLLSWTDVDGLLWYAMIFAAENGRIRLTKVPAGELEITNQVSQWGGGADGEVPLTRTFTLEPGEEKVLDLFR